MTDLTSRAMLVELQVSQWTARKYDRKVSNEVAEQHGAEHDMGRYNKNLLGKGSLSAISAIVSRARSGLKDKTLPWSDWGQRILPSTTYFVVMEDARRWIEDFNKAVDQFVAEYPALKAEAKISLNGLYQEADYPSPTKIREKFSMKAVVSPLPDSRDFRVSLGAVAQAKVQRDIEEHVQAKLRDTVTDMWKRVSQAVTHLRDRLHAYEVDPETGKVISTFRDSVTGNLLELADLLPQLNITGDPQLAEAAETLRKSLCEFEPQELRDDEAKRKEVERRAEQVLADMAGYADAA